MNIILVSIIVTAVIGAVVGLLIALASVLFRVEVDERVEIIYDMLPHFNCGACGTAGCMDMAGQLIDGKISIGNCKPSKPEQKDLIRQKLEELGLEPIK